MKRIGEKFSQNSILKGYKFKNSKLINPWSHHSDLKSDFNGRVEGMAFVSWEILT
jgi:hypothetical protein